MIPIALLKNRQASVMTSVAQQKPDGSIREEMQPEGLKEAMADLHHALKANDHDAMARAFKAAFEICESYPHEEAEGEE